jgi:hypothetical protein
MPRAYIRTDPGLFQRKALGIRDEHSRPAPYPSDAVVAFLGCLCLAEEQPKRGRFASERILRELLGGPDGQGRRYARQLPFLIEHGDLVRLPSGLLYVDGWDEWQEGDVTVPERMARLRIKKAGRDTPAVTPATVTRDTPPTVTSPSDGEPSHSRLSRGRGGKPRPVAVAETKKRSSGGGSGGNQAAAAAAGSSSVSLINLDRPDVKALKRRGWTSLSVAQLDVLDGIADNERAGEWKTISTGQRWSAAIIRAAPKGVSLLEHLVSEENRVKAERLAKAEAAEERWDQEKQQPASHSGLKTAARQLAKRVDPKANGAPTPQRRSAAIELLRQSRGLVPEPTWSQLLRRYGLTDADFEAKA